MNIKLLALSGATLIALGSPSIAAPQKAPAATAAAPVAVLAKAVDIPYTEFTLKNGLRVIVHTDHKAPVVAVSVWYNVGSKMEPKGKTGFAHLFEHLMFNGSENAPGDFFGPLKDVGATDYNGTTYFDRTNYFETVPPPALERALFLDSDRMGYLTGAITQALLDEQRGVVQNEKRQDDNQPYGLVQYKQLEGLFPPGHPYGHTTIGSMADLDSASLADVKEWFRSHYGPNNAVLVLAGDVDVPPARRLVEKYFGGIPAGPKTALPVVTIPTLPASKFETIKDRVAMTRITRAGIVPGLNDPHNVALDVAAGVLGGGSSSRLYQALVRGDRLAVRARASNQSFSQIGKFEIDVDVRPGVDPALVDKKIAAILADILAKGPTADEVQRYQVTTIANRMKGREAVGGFSGKAVTLASGALFSNDPGFYKKELAELAAETPAAVKAEADKWLSRPVYGLTIVPGPRDAYEEAKVPPPTDVKPAAAVPAKGTRGPLPTAGSIANLTSPKVERARLAQLQRVVRGGARQHRRQRQRLRAESLGIVGGDAGVEIERHARDRRRRPLRIDRLAAVRQARALDLGEGQVGDRSGRGQRPARALGGHVRGGLDDRRGRDLRLFIRVAWAGHDGQAIDRPAEPLVGLRRDRRRRFRGEFGELLLVEAGVVREQSARRQRHCLAAEPADRFEPLHPVGDRRHLIALYFVRCRPLGEEIGQNRIDLLVHARGVHPGPHIDINLELADLAEALVARARAARQPVAAPQRLVKTRARPAAQDAGGNVQRDVVRVVQPRHVPRARDPSRRDPVLDRRELRRW